MGCHETCTSLDEARRTTRATQAAAGAPFPQDALRRFVNMCQPEDRSQPLLRLLLQYCGRSVQLPALQGTVHRGEVVLQPLLELHARRDEPR